MFPVGVTDEERDLWQQRADERGLSLAAWIRETCTLRATGLLLDRAVITPPSGGKVFRGMDLKPGQKPKPK